MHLKLVRVTLFILFIGCLYTILGGCATGSSNQARQAPCVKSETCNKCEGRGYYKGPSRKVTGRRKSDGSLLTWHVRDDKRCEQCDGSGKVCLKWADGAERSYQTGPVETSADKARDIFVQGYNRCKNGNYDKEALKYLDFAIKTGNLEKEFLLGAYYYRGRCYYTMKEYQKATNDFTFLIDFDNLMSGIELISDVYYYRSLCHKYGLGGKRFKKNQAGMSIGTLGLKSAIKDMEKYIELEPEDQDGHKKLKELKKELDIQMFFQEDLDRK